MTKTFTQVDLLRYIYRETSSLENKLIELLLATDTEFHAKYAELLETTQELSKAQSKPSEATIRKILDFSKSYHLHSV